MAYRGLRLAPLHTVREDFNQAKPKLLRQACALADRPGLAYVEFGVRAGVSMTLVSETIKHPSARFYGLDTFTGLPEGWVPAYGNRGGTISTPRAPGQMAVKNMPDIDDRRVVLIKGLFQDTLPLVLPQLGDRPLFVNVDCDTYTGALYALTMMHPYLKPGDIIYFDEFVDELNEFAAFNDYVRSFYMRDRMKLVGRAYDGFLFSVS